MKGEWNFYPTKHLAIRSEDQIQLNGQQYRLHIHHLRRKLFPDVVRTVRGIGYVMDKPELVAP